MKCSFCGVNDGVDNLDVHARMMGQKKICEGCSKKNFPCTGILHGGNYKGSGPSCGAEFELNPSWATFIKIINAGDVLLAEDASLRGKSIEVVTPVLTNETYERWVRDHFDGARATLYNRAGLHLWQDSRVLGWHGLNSFLAYARKHENDFSAFVPQHRRPGEYDMSGKPMTMQKWAPEIHKNKIDFVRSIYGDCGYMLRGENHSKLKKTRPASIMKGQKRANDKGDKSYPRGPICRYWWINVHGHFRYGAIEIRLHQGTCDPNVICNIFKSWRVWMDFFSVPKNHKWGVLDPLPMYLRKYWEDVREKCNFVNYSALELAKDSI